MAQSKKHLLKRISRQCAQAGRTLAYTAYTRSDVALLDIYGQLRSDIRETMHTLRSPLSADLRQEASPVTFQHVEQLRERLLALHLRLVSTPHDGLR